MSTEKIETIETIENPGPPEELLKLEEQENIDIFDDINEYYLSILYQMCVAA